MVEATSVSALPAVPEPPPPRSRFHAVYRRLTRLGVVAAAVERPGVLRIRRALRQSVLVRERAKYAVAAMLELRGEHPYHLQESARPVWLRHPDDSWTFEEIFGARAYRLPDVIQDVLDRQPEVMVADLGANVGLFGAFILDAIPHARVVGYEPDPGNAQICRRTLGWAERSGRYRLVEAAAGVEPGTASFEAGLGGSSHVAAAPGSGTISVRFEDVMPLLAGADLAKIDIEGSEWALLTDPRLRHAGPAALALEFHPERSPTADPQSAAEDLLTAAGYRIVAPPRAFYDDEFPPGQGMLWAIRDPA